jgi:hypothetical protein
MALVTEDGTGKSDAESYISVSDADARRTALGPDATWTAATEAEKESALRVATEFIEGSFRQRWKGTKLLRAQALSWPRYGAESDGWYIDSTVVPDEVANACADLALKSLSDTLAPDLTRGIIREKVGPLETEYDTASPQSTRYRAIDMMLAPLLKGSSAMAMLVRA